MLSWDLSLKRTVAVYSQIYFNLVALNVNPFLSMTSSTQRLRLIQSYECNPHEQMKLSEKTFACGQ